MLKWISQNILENYAFQRTAKFTEMKGIVMLAKGDQMYNILKSLLVIGREMKGGTFKQENAFSTCFFFVRVAANYRHVACKRNR